MGLLCVACQPVGRAFAADRSTLDEAKILGRQNSALVHAASAGQEIDAASSNEPRLAEYRDRIAPALRDSCIGCHGPEEQEAGFRIDQLDPNLQTGDDVSRWLEVFDVVSNGEMPPLEDGLSDADRSRITQWLSKEIQTASQVRRAENGHTSFRRLTRYEYNAAMQDLLGLSYDFAADLPPETASDDGFKNSSEMLHMSAMQLEQYRELARQALQRATVQGERPIASFIAISMESLAAEQQRQQDEKFDKVLKRVKDDPEELAKQKSILQSKYAIKSGVEHLQNRDTGQRFHARWQYAATRNAPVPTSIRPQIPSEITTVAVIPKGRALKLHVGDSLPESGDIRIRVLAAKTRADQHGDPSLALIFGHQASNNSQAAERIDSEIVIRADPEDPAFYEWVVPLHDVVRNPYRGVTELGEKPNPGEFIQFVNTSFGPETLRIEYVEIETQVYDQWPPTSHRRIFTDSLYRDAEPNEHNEALYAREVLTQFMSRAWRRPISSAEVNQRMRLFAAYRAAGLHFQDAVVEVLATILASPNFLYVTRVQVGEEDPKSQESGIASQYELATRLALFLWCSLPDAELLSLAKTGLLRDQDVLIEQTKRMLGDEKAQRFSKHFVQQWLGMELLEHLEVDEKAYGKVFDESLKRAMQDEPVAFFDEVLHTNSSVMDFLHADYVMVNDRLASHYGIADVHGPEFRRVALPPDSSRGGLLTQGGLLAMNSDGKDSHPLKRGVWLLQRILDDPPPPPPPNVPEVDLTDPRILQMTLKERIEDHRNHPACYSCHARIDPWGIAFENFDAIGAWRSKIGGTPVDSTSELFNQQKLDGIEGLKRFLLTNRQDQFARALVHKMTSYALGRPLSFGDRGQVDQLTQVFRQKGDRLGDLVEIIVMSDLFLTK